MKIVIAGAGAVGFHLAELLSKENQDIALIDENEDVLEHAGTHLDVLSIKGDVTSINILQNAQTGSADLFIAVTTSESTNLLSAILAKQMGAKKTIARLKNPEYLKEDQKANFKLLGIDALISPEILAAQEIERLLKRGPFTDVYEFEGGKISVVGFTLDTESPIIGHSISEIKTYYKIDAFRVVALLRGEKTIIPRGGTTLQKGDHLYISARDNKLEQVMKIIGKASHQIKKVMIIGNTPLALRTAQLLEDKYSVTLVAAEKKVCKNFLETLGNTLIVQQDPSDVDALRGEGLRHMDAFIALTPNSETNIITSLMAEETGVIKTIALVDNVNYTHISQNIGIDTIINKKLIAANNIFRFVRKGKVEAIASLHGVEAEMIEFEIHKNNRLLKNPLNKLHLPEDSIIVGAIRGEQSFLPEGDFQLEIGDKVIILASPGSIHKVEEIFK